MPPLLLLIQIFAVIVGLLSGAVASDAFMQPAVLSVVVSDQPSTHSMMKTISGLKEKPMRTILRTLLISIIAPAAAALAEGDPPKAAVASPVNPLSAHSKQVYGGIKKILLRSAEKMAEENYAFKPTEAVRSFGQIVGHVADSQYFFCSAVLGEKNPALNVEETKTSKADLIAALKSAFAYCDRAYDGMTDASASETVKLMGETPKLSALSINQMHTTLHYGNLITYMRLKNVVPPSSEPEFMRQLRK